MKDARGNEIKVGDTLIRIVEAPGSRVGEEFTVNAELWDEEESLVARNDHQGQLLWDERAKEYEVKKG